MGLPMGHGEHLWVKIGHLNIWGRVLEEMRACRQNDGDVLRIDWPGWSLVPSWLYSYYGQEWGDDAVCRKVHPFLCLSRDWSSEVVMKTLHSVFRRDPPHPAAPRQVKGKGITGAGQTVHLASGEWAHIVIQALQQTISHMFSRAAGSYLYKSQSLHPHPLKRLWHRETWLSSWTQGMRHESGYRRYFITRHYWIQMSHVPWRLSGWAFPPKSVLY